jgi:foldase protein PrsA
MRSPLRFVPALGAFFVLTLALAACGNAVPGNAVVSIDGDPIERADFERWMQIAAVSTQGPPPQAEEGEEAATPAVVVPEPPEFTACIANKEENAPEPAEGQPTPTAGQLRQQCEQEYESLRDQVLQFLISAEWIEGEAADQGVRVSQEAIDKQFEETKEQSFPEEADFDEFLKTSGMRLTDIKYRIRLDLMSEQLREKVVEGADEVSNDEVREYYKENQQRFAQPERRDLRIVLTETEEQANEAKAALEGDRSFSSVAEEFSTDEGSKEQGGVLLAVAQGQQEKALDDAVFAAEQGQLQGPVETQFGWYVFQVQKITEAEQQTVQEAAPTIRQLLASQGQEEALNTFITDFRDKWKDRTNCREGFITQDCKNAPDPPEGQEGVPGAPGAPGAPQGGQVPPQDGQVPPQDGQVPPQDGQVPQQEIPVPQEVPPPPAEPEPGE